MKSFFSPQRLPVWLLLVASCLALTTQAQTVTADPLTGRASTSIPLCTVTSGNLSAPVSLYYATNGVKANDGEGTAGMGWSLAAGGEVFRDLRGLPDDYVGKSGDARRGWLSGTVSKQVNNFVPAADLNLSVCTDETADYTTLAGFGSTFDTEPDVFSFHAPGLSGQFVFDKNKKPQPIPYQDLKIVVTRGADSLINQVEITTNVGVTYTFQTGDKITRQAVMKTTTVSAVNYFTTLYNYYYLPVSFNNSWVLTSVLSPSGASLSFGYGDYNLFETQNGFAQIVNNTTNKVDTIYSISDQVSSRLLSYITGSNTTAGFNWNANLLSSVSFSDKSYNSAKYFQLSYKYIKSKYHWTRDMYAKRAFLSGMFQQVNCQSIPGYSFSYYGVDFTKDSTSLPYKLNKYQDIYGYYNGTATSATPEVYVASGDTGTDGERYRIAPASGYVLLASGGGRSVNPSVVHYGALKSVTLPSGGVTTVTYEPADYFDALTGTTLQGGGIRVKSIKVSGNDPASDMTSTYSYKRSKGSVHSSGQWIYRPMLAFNNVTEHVRVPYNIAPDEAILYARTEVAVSGKGKTVFEFQVPGVYAQISNGDFAATLSRVARPNPGSGSCAAVGGVKTGYYTFPYTVNTNYDFERGLPTKVSTYTSARKLVSQKLYTYQRTSVPVVQVSGVRFEKINNSFYQYGKYTLLSNVDKVALTETNRSFDQADTTKYVETATSYTYNLVTQLLSRVSTTNSDNSVLTQDYLYAKDYATTGTDNQSAMINGLVSNFQHGTVVETISKNSGTVTGASLTIFDNRFTGGRILPQQQLTLGDPSGFTPTSVSGTAFTYSNKYYPTLYIDGYDALGTPLITRNQRKEIASVKMGYNNSLPILNISNARNDQVIYADFEAGENNTITLNGATLVTSDSWAGRSCLSVSPGNTPQVSVSSSSTQWGNQRFSLWVKGSAAATLTVQFNNGAAWVSANVTYPAAGQSAGTWQYVEGRMNATNPVSGSVTLGNFPLQVSTTAAVLVDNVMFYPESAEVTAHAYEPLLGKTADLDSRGNASFVEYDQLGRPRYLKNKDKDLVQIKDYHYKSQTTTPASAWITRPNTGCTSGVLYTLTAATSCMPGATYAWYVDGVLQAATGSTFSYVYTQNRNYRVKLVATNSDGSTSGETTVHPTPYFSADVSFTGPGSFNDTDPGTRTATVTVAGGCGEAITYRWTNSAGGSGSSASPSIPINLVWSVDNTITVWAESTCYNYDRNQPDNLVSTKYTQTYIWKKTTTGN